MSSQDAGAYPDEEPLPEQAGARLGDYTFLQKIGIGSTGEVWLAAHSSGRFLALKVLRDEWFQDSKQIERLRSEGAIMHQLRHPGICRIYEVGEIEGVHFVAMEFVDGMSLYDILWAPAGSWNTLAERDWSSLITAARDFRIAHPDIPMALRPSILLPAGQVVDLMVKICDAVAAAHERGIPHRDLKPGNILLFQDGRPVVVDFGLAKVNVPGALVAEEAELLGTLEYMAPEQAVDSNAVNERADVYSLGVILYVMLTGRNAFEQSGSIEEDLARLQNEHPVPPRKANPAIDPGLEAIVLKCLQKNPAMRYASAAWLRDDLARHARGEALSARRGGPGHSLSAGSGALVAAGLAALGGIAVALWLWSGNVSLRKTIAEIRAGAASSAAQIGNLENQLAEKDRVIAELEARIVGPDSRSSSGPGNPDPGEPAPPSATEPENWEIERQALVAANQRLSNEVLALRGRLPEPEPTPGPPPAPEIPGNPDGGDSLNFDEEPRDDSASPEQGDFEDMESPAEDSSGAPAESEEAQAGEQQEPPNRPELYPALIDELLETLPTGGRLVIFPPGVDRYTARRKNYPQPAAELLREMDQRAALIARNGPETADDFELLIGRELFLMRVPEAFALVGEYHAAHPDRAADFLKNDPPRLFSNFGQIEFFFRLNPPGPRFQKQLGIMRAFAAGFKGGNNAPYTRETAPALFQH